MAYARQLPVDMSLLRLQDKHIVKSIWEGNERVICPRRHAIWIAKHVNELDERVMNILQAAGFIHILKASTLEINHHLVTALVERWRVETHTFHLPLGESSITLEDVALQLGLPIEGHVVTGIRSGPLTVFCHQLLGDVPPENNFIWTPYRRDLLPQIIPVEVAPTCRAVVPLICFSVVEYQQSDRVMRQFGFRQNIPHPPMNLDVEHKQDMRGRADWNWQEHHGQWIALWNDRHNCVFNDIPFQKNGHLRDESEYMQ
ncbi:hypothetical protein VIGAN_11138800 [Vigna angularis var. angularis]|uniref:Aminotransferase-like plant mobile domain-containing protein n=1 Tax=Vigna angularis var. angularis TaxID=157739 RepID=A0A0S3TAD6_PHAAN|nr:hypothetical protein VIGAN_11138800 [Vigna angularis var. angularis]